MQQWHPVFAHLLRPLVQDYYEVRTDVPVGDLPRQADIVLLQRTAEPPFRGVWSHLLQWNVLEFKGPTDDPGLRDLDLLWEVALGIERRLNEDRAQQGHPAMERTEVSWWYTANHVGRRFRGEAEHLLGSTLECLNPGLWRGRVMGRRFFIVSRDTLPVERESVPLHLVTLGAGEEQEMNLAREVTTQVDSWKLYGGWLRILHPRIWPEVEQMIRDVTDPTQLHFGRDFLQVIRDLKLDEGQEIRDLIGEVGLKELIALVGRDQFIEELGPEQVVKAMGFDRFLKGLTSEQLEEFKRRLS